jgi:hypothetical protein
MPADVSDIVALVLLLAAAGGFLVLLLRRRGGEGCSCSCSKLACPTDLTAQSDHFERQSPAKMHPQELSQDRKETNDL